LAAFTQNDPVRMYQLEDYINRLTGFKVEIIAPDDLKPDESFVFQDDESFNSISK
jgi:hypothetical protein